MGLFKTKKFKPSQNKELFFILTHKEVFHYYQKLNCQTTVKEPILFQSAENVSVITDIFNFARDNLCYCLTHEGTAVNKAYQTG